MSTPTVHHRVLTWLPLALLIGLMAVWGTPVVAQDAQSLTVLSADTSAYPTVHFTARVSDANGFSILGLTGEHFRIDEARATPPQATTTTQPLNLVVVFDRSPIGGVEINMYKALATKIAALYQEGDNIWFMQPEGEPIAITNVATLTTFTNSMRFRSSDDEDVNMALNRATGLLLPAQQANGNVHIIFVASYTVATPDWAYTSTIPLHVLQLYGTGTNRTNFTDKLRPLAKGRFYTAADNVESVDILEFIAALGSSHTVYDVSYESRAAQVGLRSIPVSVGSAVGVLQFEKNVVAPQVEIVSSESNFKIVRTQFNDQNDAQAAGVNFDKPSETLKVQAAFPDGVDRNITQATLYVDDQAQPPAQIAFDPAANAFDLTWDLSAYTTTAAHTLRVEAVDEFGAIGISPDKTFDVAMNVVLPTVIEMTQVTGVEVPGGGTVGSGVVYAGYALLLIVLLLAVGFIFWQRQRIGEGLQNVGRSVIFGMEEIGRKTSIAFGRTTDYESSGDNTNYRSMGMVGGTSEVGRGPTEIEGTNLGGKTDVEGDTVPPTVGMGHELAIFNVTADAGTGLREIVMRQPRMTLGRTREAGVDEVIRYPKISQIHCLIEYDHHEKVFYIRDEGATNGTFVNGRRLTPNQREQLPPNAAIRLGQAFEMRFQPNARMLEGQRPMTADPARRPVSTRVELMEGMPPTMPPQNGWPPNTGEAYPPFRDPHIDKTRLAPPTNFVPEPPKKTPPAKPNGGSGKKDEWMD